MVCTRDRSGTIGTALGTTHRSSKYFHNSGRTHPIYCFLITINIGFRVVMVALRRVEMQSQYWFTKDVRCWTTSEQCGTERTILRAASATVCGFSRTDRSCDTILTLFIWRGKLMGTGSNDSDATDHTLLNPFYCYNYTFVVVVPSNYG